MTNENLTPRERLNKYKETLKSYFVAGVFYTHLVNNTVDKWVEEIRNLINTEGRYIEELYRVNLEEIDKNYKKLGEIDENLRQTVFDKYLHRNDDKRPNSSYRPPSTVFINDGKKAIDEERENAKSAMNEAKKHGENALEELRKYNKRIEIALEIAKILRDSYQEVKRIRENIENRGKLL